MSQYLLNYTAKQVDKAIGNALALGTINDDNTTEIELSNGIQFRRGTVEELTIALPDPVPNELDCSVMFTSGETPSTVSLPGGVALMGSDWVADGVFTPVANTRYNLLFWFDGAIVWCSIIGAAYEGTAEDDEETGGNEGTGGSESGGTDEGGDDSGDDSGTTETPETGGTGTEDDPYLIATADDMYTLANDVDAGDNKSGVYYALSADIDFGDFEWNPIGANGKNNATLYPDSAAGFAGTLDGRGHVISNMTVGGDTMYGGLFGSNFSGTVMNLGIDESGLIELTVASSTCGAIARKGTGKIINCYSLVPTAAVARSAGIIDELETGGMVLGCYQAATVTPNGTGAFAIKAATTTTGAIKYCLWDSTKTANGVNGSGSAYANNTGITTAEFATAHETLNGNLSAVASEAGVDVSKLCAWEVGDNGYPRLVVA